MRLAVIKNQNRIADIFCDDTRKAKEQLRKNNVTQLYLDHYLVGRENGRQLLTWAINQQLVPNYVVVTEVQPQKRQSIINLLEANGYRTADGINFIKYH